MRVLRVYHAGRDAAHRERERALARAGVEVTLVVPSQWPGPDDLGAEPFDVVELPVRRPGDVNRHVFRTPSAIADLVARVQPDLLDLHEEPFSSVVHQVLGQVPPDLPVVTYTAQNINKRFPPPFAHWEQRALRRAQGIYPCTRQAASVVVGKGFRGIVRVLPLGTPAAVTAGHQALDSDGPELLLVGRLVPEKGVLDAVRVLAGLRAVRTPARLTIVGTGPEGAAARALAAELGVDGYLSAEPWLGPADLAGRYRRAHVLLAPSRSTRTWVEQFGRMATEAQAAGAVVAGYASGSLPEVVGATAVLVPEGDVAGLTAAVAALLADPARWSAVRVAGMAAAAGRTWDAVARGQVELYAQVLAPSSGAAGPIVVADYGSPAGVAGGGRPFALPVLREDNRATRALARVIDSARPQARPVPTGRLRVVYVDHVARMSGGEVALARLVAALPDVDAHAILAEDGPLRAALESAGATVEILPLAASARDVRRTEVTAGLGGLRVALTTVRYTLRLAARLRALQPDLVHTNSLKSGYYGSVAARLARRPVIWHVRDRVAEDYLPRRAVRLTHLALRRLPHLVLCNSAETLRCSGLADGRVVHDPYAAASVEPCGRAAPVIGMIGRLSPWKGQDVFVRAFAAAFANTPGVSARIVGSAMFGEDAYATELAGLIDSLGLADRITLAGFSEDVERELAGMAVLVHASTVPEPFGQVVVEGMAAGLAVIATRAGGPVEIITPEVDGVLVEPGDVGELADALARLMGDADLRDRLGSAAQARSRDFRPDVIGPAVSAVYREVVARYGRR